MIHSIWGIILTSNKEEMLVGGDAEIGFLSAGNQPVIAYSLQAFEQCPEIDHIAIVAKRDRAEGLRGLCKMFGISKAKKVIAGTTQKMTSVQAGLDAVREDATMVVIHDVSRPCIDVETISETVKAAKRYGCASAATRLDGIVKETGKGQKATKSYDGSTLWAVQSPQAYRVELLEKGLAAAKKKSSTQIKDPSATMDLINQEMHLVSSPVTNYRISGPDELTLVSQLLGLD